MESEKSTSMANKRNLCHFCHKKSQYRVHINSSYYQIKCIHCANHFLACADFDCTYCVNNKRAWSYKKTQISSKRRKTPVLNTFYDCKKDSSSNNHKIFCPLRNFRLKITVLSIGKKRSDIKCINYNEMLIWYRTCTYSACATSHVEKKMRKNQCCCNKQDLSPQESS